jgi:hypothetical protein
MPLHLKLNEQLDEDDRREVLDALAQAGFEAEPLFPGQKRPSLASIYSITAEGRSELERLRRLLKRFQRAVDYTEMTPDRKPM